MVLKTCDIAQLLYHQVHITTTADSPNFVGYLKAFDPISRSVIVCKVEDSEVIENVIILGQHIIRVELINPEDSILACEVQKVVESDTLRRLSKVPFLRLNTSCSLLSKEELEHRRNDIQAWLIKNRIPVKVDSSSGDIIIADSVRVRSPYENTTDYTCPSGTVLKRFKHIVDSRLV